MISFSGGILRALAEDTAIHKFTFSAQIYDILSPDEDAYPAEHKIFQDLKKTTIPTVYLYRNPQTNRKPKLFERMICYDQN